MIRRRARHAVRRLEVPEKATFYIPSLSARTVVYKGMLNCDQLPQFYPDLRDDRVESALALVHSRFSTNTFPSWQRAHPYRLVAHNGEINTLRGNVNWMHARESMFKSRLFGDDLAKCIPVIDTDGSDSGMFDNVLELLMLAGRSLPHAMMMMIPEPWSNHESMSQERKDFYEFHGCLMEPWDGPASVAFTDGIRIGATLDRNGLRPSRYYVTKDGLVVMASEVGVLDIPPENILEKGRLQPGRMFLVDTSQGRIIGDDEIKNEMAAAAPYGAWIKENMVAIGDLPKPATVIPPDRETVLRRQETFGYTTEDLKVLVAPMASDGVEATGSMGTDTPLAVLSNRPQLLYNYFKQLFAQVTNPPVDAIREEIIMAVDTSIGPEGNLLEPTPASARQIKLPTPVLRNEELEKLRHLDGHNGSHGFKSITLPTLYPVKDGGEGLAAGIETLRAAASKAIEDGCNIIILSDRGHDRDRAPIPALLAIAAVQHHLLREGSRTRVGLVVESGEPREMHHFALLLGYGASAINPYLAFETLADLCNQGLLPGDASQESRGQIRQGNRQGDREGLLEDGDLDHPELSRRPGVRGDRPQPGVHRRILHLDGVARGRHRHRRDRARHPGAPGARVPRAPAAVGQSGSGRPVPVPQERRVPPVQPGHHPQAAAGLSHRRLRRLQGVLAPHRRSVEVAGHAARPDGAEVGPAARAARRGRARGRRSSSASRPARCRTDRSAARRTRRWRSR